MPAAPRIRPATAADIDEITRIYRGYVLTGSASFELEPPDTDEMERRRASVLAAGLPYLVAEVEGRIGGYGYAGPYRPRPAYAHTVEDSVYVAEWAQRRGIGRSLLARLVSTCEAAGKRQMIAIIGDSANTASVGLHRALGFRHAGTLRDVGWKFGRWLDTVIMQRPLGTGADQPPGPA